MKINLKFKNGAEQTLILGDKTLIGRDKNCTISLPDDDRVSRRHAAILKKGDNYWLTDLRSVNGTYLNGESLSTHQLLKNQDQIVIGRSSITVLAGGAPQTESFDLEDDATVFDRSSPETAQRLSDELNAELDEETQFLSKETLQDLYGVSAEELYFVKGFKEGETFQLPTTPITIGRDSSNTLCFPCGSVSGRHAVITPREQGYFIKDLGSSNGTFVNKLKLAKESLLHPGDLIQVGDIAMRFGDKPASAIDSKNQHPGKAGGKLIYGGLLLILIGVGVAYHLMTPATISKTPSESSIAKGPSSQGPPEMAAKQAALDKQPEAVETKKDHPAPPSPAELRAQAKSILSNVIRMYVDGDIAEALSTLEKIHALPLPEHDEMRQLAGKAEKGIQECLSLYQSGRQSYIHDEIEAAVEQWDKVLSCEAGFLDPTLTKTSAISRNIRKMMAEQLYLRVVKLAEENNMVMAKQYCIEVLKAIPQHRGCLEILQDAGP